MPNDKEHYVGIDVAKDGLDVAVLGEKRTRQFANTKKGRRDLVRWMSQLQPKLIVGEATGGYEEALVSPQRVRHYARAKGRLAKTDPLDAQLLAAYGKAIQPRLFVGKSEERKQLSALVGRRNQLNDLLQAEKNRLRARRVPFAARWSRSSPVWKQNCNRWINRSGHSSRRIPTSRHKRNYCAPPSRLER